MSLRQRADTLRQILRHPANLGRRRSAVVDYLRWNVGHRILGVDYVLPLVDDARVILSNRQNYATLTYVNRLWDFPEMMFMLHFLRQEDRFADLGANAGVYTVLASAAAGARTLAVEPVPATFAELQCNIRLNDMAERVEAVCCGVGAVAGSLRMTATRGGMNHMVADVEKAGAGTVEIPIRTLDELLSGRACSMIKLDVEGFEHQVMAGAPATLASDTLHALVVELNGSGERFGVSDQDVHAVITGYGFVPMDYHAAERRLSPRASFDGDSFNTLYVRESDHVADRLRTARRFRVRGIEA